jgi:dihydroflavonol-4-reductase
LELLGIFFFIKKKKKNILNISYGDAPKDRPFNENDWTNPEKKDLQPYMYEGYCLVKKKNLFSKSKTLAERAAWDFIKSEGKGLELVVFNPTGVFGPVLSDDFSGSISMIKVYYINIITFSGYFFFVYYKF